MLREFLILSDDADERHCRVVSDHDVGRAAAQVAALDHAVDPQRPITYRARDVETGVVTDVEVVFRPAFVPTQLTEVPMPPATHVLWGGTVLCPDRRLVGVPATWPADQRWISLRAVADGAPRPGDACAHCWTRAPEIAEGLRQIGAS